MEDEAAVEAYPELTEQDLALLELERSWWKHPAPKNDTIRARLGLSTTQYYAALNRLIDRPEALDADPLLVKRLRRLRGAHRQRRSGAGSLTLRPTQTGHVNLDR